MFVCPTFDSWTLATTSVSILEITGSTLKQIAVARPSNQRTSRARSGQVVLYRYTVKAYEQCGGESWQGSTCCIDGFQCTVMGQGNRYSQVNYEQRRDNGAGLSRTTFDILKKTSLAGSGNRYSSCLRVQLSIVYEVTGYRFPVLHLV